jgi:hypothetical protein
MCYNKEVSFVLVLFVIASIMKYIKTGQWFYVSMLIAYGLIQLSEFIIHLGLDNRNNTLNYIGSIMVPIILSLQPLIITLGSLDDPVKNKTLRNMNWILIGMYTLIFWAFLANMIISRKNILSDTNTLSGRLNWNTFANNSYISLLLTVMYVVVSCITFYNSGHTNIIYLFLGTLLAATVYSLYYSGNLLNGNVFGTMWCLFAIVLIIMSIVFGNIDGYIDGYID